MDRRASVDRPSGIQDRPAQKVNQQTNRLMYPDITPRLRLEETISNPFDPAEVLAFTGRNKALGDSAVIVKETALAESDDCRVVEIPKETADRISNETAEFIVLLEDRVLAMTATDFVSEHRHLPILHQGGAVRMAYVNLSNEKFRTFPQSEVEVEN